MRNSAKWVATVSVSALILAGAPGTALAAEDDSADISSRSQAEYLASSEAAVGTLSGHCGVQVNLPHASWSENNEIHTRVESFCDGEVLVNNTIRGESYRSRWWGWRN